MHIGNRIKKIRESLHINRKDFARGIVSYSHLCNIEDGNYNASEDIMIAIAKRLNVPSEYLIGHNKIDFNLDNHLMLLKHKLDQLNITESEAILKIIKNEYLYISSTSQETFFFLLKSYYHFVIGDNKTAKQIFQKEVLPLLDNVTIDNLIIEYKEIYYYIQGVINYYEENYRLSYKYFLKQLPLIKNNLMKARVNHNIAICLYKKRHNEDSIIYALNSLNLHLTERRWDKLAEVDNLLGVLYIDTRQYDAAEVSLNNALELIDKNNSEYLRSKILHNLGKLSHSKHDYDEAIRLYNESLNLKRKDNTDLYITYNKLLEIYLTLELYDKLAFYLNEAKGICRSNNELYQLKIFEGKLHLYNGDYQQYEKITKGGIKYLYKNNFWNGLEKHTEEFAEYYMKYKKYKNAAKYFNLSIEIYKSFYKEEEEN